MMWEVECLLNLHEGILLLSLDLHMHCNF